MFGIKIWNRIIYKTVFFSIIFLFCFSYNIGVIEQYYLFYNIGGISICLKSKYDKSNKKYSYYIFKKQKDEYKLRELLKNIHECPKIINNIIEFTPGSICIQKKSNINFIKKYHLLTKTGTKLSHLTKTQNNTDDIIRFIGHNI